MVRTWSLGRRAGSIGLVAVLALAAIGARALEARRVDDVPFCPVFGRGRVGSDWARRLELADEPAPGELADFSIYDREGFDASAVHPEVRRFYERTADYDLAYETTWHRGFRVGARLASFLTSRLEQLNLPGRTDGRVRHLESEIATVRPGADPRGSRVWTRTDPVAGTAVFVALYATHERDGVTYANVAVPLPWSNLSTVLRPEREAVAPNDGGDGDDDGNVREANSPAENGVQFTTRDGAGGHGASGVGGDETGDGDGGLYLVTPLGAFRLPLEQTFRVWPADAPAAPSVDATLIATHEMWVFGRQFLTIRYGIDRSGTGDGDGDEEDGDDDEDRDGDEDGAK